MHPHVTITNSVLKYISRAMRDFRRQLRFFYIFFITLSLQNSKVTTQSIDDDLMPELYKKYQEIFNHDNAESAVLFRRKFAETDKYSIHIQNLKNVNGFKRHNLVIKEKTRSGSPIIYINNPVESNIPNSYLTLDEFKEVLSNRTNSIKDPYNIVQEEKKKVIITNKLTSKKVLNVTFTSLTSKTTKILNTPVSTTGYNITKEHINDHKEKKIIRSDTKKSPKSSISTLLTTDKTSLSTDYTSAKDTDGEPKALTETTTTKYKTTTARTERIRSRPRVYNDAKNILS